MKHTTFALVLLASLFSITGMTAASACPNSEYELSGSLKQAYDMYSYDRCPTAPQLNIDVPTCCNSADKCDMSNCKCTSGHCSNSKNFAKDDGVVWSEKQPKHHHCPLMKLLRAIKYKLVK